MCGGEGGGREGGRGVHNIGEEKNMRASSYPLYENVILPEMRMHPRTLTCKYFYTP